RNGHLVAPFDALLVRCVALCLRRHGFSPRLFPSEQPAELGCCLSVEVISEDVELTTPLAAGAERAALPAPGHEGARWHGGARYPALATLAVGDPGRRATSAGR